MLTAKDLDEIEKIVNDKLDEKTKLLPSKDQFFSKMDEVMGELKAIRDEQAVLSNCKDQLEDHEERISKLEAVTTA